MSDKQQLHWLRDECFVKLIDGKAILWDYLNHRQYEVDQHHLVRLLQFSGGDVIAGAQVDDDILGADLLVTEPKRTKWGWDWLSHVFHVGTSHAGDVTSLDEECHAQVYERSYIEFCASLVDQRPHCQLVKGGPKTVLTAPDLSKLQAVSLWDALVTRKTCRDFADAPVGVEEVATLLYCAFGAVDRKQEPGTEHIQQFGYRRTSPSAGGLQCAEPYVWARKISGLEPGIYHYLSQTHELERVRDLPAHPLGTYLCNQYWSNDLPFAIVMTCSLRKMWWKYPHSRAYRPMLMEVGHLSQTLNLCITALGLRPWLTGYFHDRELDRLLSVEESECSFLVVGAGKGSGSSYSRTFRQVASEVADELSNRAPAKR
jgi:SagB-type dehydrogenase family enzyme